MTPIIRKKKRAWNYFFLALPLVALVLLMNYAPLFGWYLSLLEYRPGYPLFENKFVGLKYFGLLLNSRDLARVFKNTIIFSTINFCLLPLPMLFAILLNEIKLVRFRKIVQTMTTLPYFIGWVIVFSLAFSIFASDGVLNQVFVILGRGKQSVMTDPKAVYWFQGSISIWKGLGWNAIIYIAAIAGIDQELYEAATVDGAGRLRCVIHITAPGLMPTFVVLMLLTVSNFVNQGLEQYYVFKNSMVYNNIEVLDLYTYRVGLQLGDYSFATAVGIVKSMISITLLFSVNAIARRVRGASIV